MRRKKATVHHEGFVENGANSRIRTDDLRFTKALLYQLSYVGAKEPRRDFAPLS